MKQFYEFKGKVKNSFRKLMIFHWMDDEGYKTESEALKVYGGEKFDRLCGDLIGSTKTFIPDLGYKDENINGTLCFEKEDNCFCIPIDFTNIISTHIPENQNR